MDIANDHVCSGLQHSSLRKNHTVLQYMYAQITYYVVGTKMLDRNAFFWYEGNSYSRIRLRDYGSISTDLR